LIAGIKALCRHAKEATHIVDVAARKSKAPPSHRHDDQDSALQARAAAVEPEGGRPAEVQRAGRDSAGREIGTRHKLGGNPAFLQGPETPLCPDCKEPITFYGQLDSINDDFCLADCGIIYVFVCFDCYKTASFIHS
jgi:hypothetical protein